MREPGSTFEYQGETLHVVIATNDDDQNTCTGCVGNEDLHTCHELKDDERPGEDRACGPLVGGVVFVRSIEQFKIDCVAAKLSL
jgi:hypothetical protein